MLWLFCQHREKILWLHLSVNISKASSSKRVEAKHIWSSLSTEFLQWKECELTKFLFISVSIKWVKAFLLNNKKLQGLDLWLDCLYSEHIVCVGLVLILEQGNYSSSKWQIQSIAISEEENIFLLKFFLLKYMYYTTLYVIIRIQLGLFSLT